MSFFQRARDRFAREDGAILVLAAVLLIVLFGVAALAVDITLKSSDRQQLWNSTDAAALAGASQLPDDGLAAEALANTFALANDADLAGGVGVTFRCLVGDRDGDGQPDASDIPAACDPGPDVLISAPPFVCAGGICTAPCVPADGDTCNTIVLETEKTTDYAFAPAIGIDQGDTEILSAACRGTCGGALTGPVDLMIIIDRTGSMSASELANAKNAALAVLDYFDPALQHVGLAVLGAGNGLGSCGDLNPANLGASWLNVRLSSDYKDTLNFDYNGDGINDLDSTSSLVSRIRCLTSSGQGTNLGSPISDDAFNRPDALDELLANGRAGVKKGIILLSDGAANQPSSVVTNECRYAADMAQKAKNAGVEIFTIGFGVVGEVCVQDSSGKYNNAVVTRLLADMATQPSSDNCQGAGAAVENTDGDHFFCEPKSSDLSDVFLTAAAQFAGGSKLVQLPPGG